MKFEGYSEDEIEQILDDIDKNGLKPYYSYPDSDIRNYFRSGKKKDLDKYSRKKPDGGPDDEPSGGDGIGRRVPDIAKDIIDSVTGAID